MIWSLKPKHKIISKSHLIFKTTENPSNHISFMCSLRYFTEIRAKTQFFLKNPLQRVCSRHLPISTAALTA